MTLEERLTQIEARAQAATAAPWREGTANVWQDETLYMVAATEWWRNGKRWPTEAERRVAQNDAAFIAAARADVPWLTCRLREAMALVRELMPHHLMCVSDTGNWCPDCGARHLSGDTRPGKSPEPHDADCPRERARKWLAQRA